MRSYVSWEAVQTVAAALGGPPPHEPRSLRSRARLGRPRELNDSPIVEDRLFAADRKRGKRSGLERLLHGRAGLYVHSDSPPARARASEPPSLSPNRVDDEDAQYEENPGEQAHHQQNRACRDQCVSREEPDGAEHDTD